MGEVKFTKPEQGRVICVGLSAMHELLVVVLSKNGIQHGRDT